MVPIFYALRVVAIAALLATGCRRNSAPAKPPTAPPPAAASYVVDGQAALAEVERLLAIGPRVATTDGARRAAEHIAERLRAAGIEPLVDEFQDPTPSGPRTFRNVIAALDGDGKRTIVLLSHFDTKGGIGDDFVGANDSGSSTGLLLELARTLAKPGRHGPDLLLAFLDGEECARAYTPEDGLHGSRRLAESLARTLAHRRVIAVILLDMVGDRNLSVTIPVNSSPDLRRLALTAAHEAGVRQRFSLSSTVIVDDHVPFMRLGMPAINLIDFDYGPGTGGNEYWHTPQDTLDKLSAESLRTVGEVVLRMVDALSRRASSTLSTPPATP